MGNNPEAAIILSGLMTLTLAALAHIRRNKTPPPVGLFIAVGIVYTILSALSQFAPAIAGGMAVLIMVTAIFQYAEPVLDYVVKVGGVDNLNAPKKGKK